MGTFSNAVPDLHFHSVAPLAKGAINDLGEEKGPLESQPVLLSVLQLSLPVPVFLRKERPVSLPGQRGKCPLLMTLESWGMRAPNSLSPLVGLSCPSPLSNKFFFQFKRKKRIELSKMLWSENCAALRFSLDLSSPALRILMAVNYL